MLVFILKYLVVSTCTILDLKYLYCSIGTLQVNFLTSPGVMKLLLVSLLLVPYGAIFVFTKGKFKTMSRSVFIELIVFYFKS